MHRQQQPSAEHKESIRAQDAKVGSSASVRAIVGRGVEGRGVENGALMSAVASSIVEHGGEEETHLSKSERFLIDHGDLR